MSEIESIRPALTVILDDGDWIIRSVGSIGAAMARTVLPIARSVRRSSRNPATSYEYLVSVVTKTNTDSCLIWPFYANKQGYGTLTILSPISGKRGPVLAHRLAYKVVYGEWPMPKGLHRCDNPRCFNPLHIFPGTPRENSADMVAKNRQAKGERMGLSKLTFESVVQARSDYAAGVTCPQLANRYGVSVPIMAAALSGRGWKHVPDPIPRMRSAKILATHCLHGHPFVEGSFYVHRLPSGAIHRQCKICTNNRHYARMAAKPGGSI